jgi:hypothetical protein
MFKNLITAQNRKLKFELDAHPWLGIGIAAGPEPNGFAIQLALPVLVFSLTFKKKSDA